MLVQVYGDNAMKKTTVYKWVKRFTEGRESVTDEERSGRPATSRNEETIEDLDMRKVCAKMVQKELAEEQSKEESQFAETFWRGKMTFLAVSSQVMKHGSTNTTLK